MTVLDVALSWRAKGIATIPIERGDKRPTVLWSSYHRRLPTKDELQYWFAPQYNPAGAPNIAVVVGWKGLVVLDFDQLDLYLLWRSWCETQQGIVRELPELTYQVLTSRGMHVYLFVDEPVQNRKLLALDIQAKIKYVIAPPSVHPSGHVYTALDRTATIIQVPCIEMILPEELLVEEEPEHVAHVQRVQSERQLVDDVFGAAMQPADFVFDGPISEIHETHDITALVGDLVRKGPNFYARCPLHDDSDPSMQVKDGRVKCWAGCTNGKWFDYIDLFAALNGLSNQEAIKELVP